MIPEIPTVLVVDNEPEVCGVVADYLRMQGYAVLTTGDGEEALAVLSEREVHFVFLSVCRPGMNGFEVLRQIHLRHPKVIVVMVSGAEMEELRSETSQPGASDYTAKSFQLGRLATVVRVLEAVKPQKECGSSCQ